MRAIRSVASYPLRRWPRLSKVVAGSAALLVAVVAAGNAYVLWAAPKGRMTDEVANVPRAEVAIVPGALVKPDGEMSSMLADRVWRAAAPGR